jgi:glycosyltransferase involved in cell wall biosynthesis
LRILDIIPRFPYPPVDGGSKAVYYSLRSLARRGHSIHLACLADEVDAASVRELEKVFTVDVVANSGKPTAMGALRSIVRRTPYQLSRFHNAKLLGKARSILRSSSFDILQVEGLHAAYYALLLGVEYNLPTVLRVQDLMSVKLMRDIEHSGDLLMKLWLRFDMRRLSAYEKSACARVSCNLMISEVERDLVQREVPDARCDYVPTGVDLDEFVPVPEAEELRSILWLGALYWAPNRDSFWWFYSEIVPEIVRREPDVRIRVAGIGAPPEILAVRHPNVEVLGYVPDVRELMARSQVCVVPLQVGSGVRVKLLEMFAMRKAVVSTTVGAEGLRVVHGAQALIADSAATFADSVCLLLNDAVLRERLGRKAREHVERYFSWEKIAGEFEAVYRSLLDAAAKNDNRIVHGG